MKKKDQSEPESKRRRKSIRSETNDRDSENKTASSKSAGQAEERAATKRSPKTTSVKQDASKQRDLSEISVMQLEEKEAEERVSADDVVTYKKTCSEIQRLVSEANDLKLKGKLHNSTEIIERRIQATLLTTSLKKLSRLSLIRGKKAKEKTQELKQKVDVLHLDLQNLLYEVMHMKKEIRNCTEFTSKDEDIDLVDIDQFYEEAPTDISKPDLTKTNSHQQMLARLGWELEQRKKLASMKDQLGKTKEEMEREILQKKDTLESLQPSLQEILKATLPVQEKLGLNIDAKKAQYETALYLPKPLYIFYVQACAYRDSTDQNLVINIDGDLQSAKACLERDKLDSGEYEESDAEDNNEAGDKEENKRRKHRKDKEKARLEEKRKSLLRQHPLTVNVKITFKGTLSVTMQFSYLPALHITTINISVDFSKDHNVPVITSSSLVAPDSLLRNLFPGDDGSSSPNPSNQFQLNALGLEDFSCYVQQIGRPFYWVQRVCGLHYLPNTPAESLVADADLSSQNIESVMKAIKQRITSRLSLQQQLASLETLVVPATKNTSNRSPSNVLTSLIGWKCITHSDFIVLDYTKEMVEADLVDQNDNFFVATLRREKETIEAAIVIGVDYPCQPPLVALKHVTSRHNFDDSAIKDIECDLNTKYADSPDEKPDKLLSVLLNRLQVCFDIFCETGDTGIKRERLFIKTRRGRDRMMPFKYLPEKGFFIH